jgi:hypothetical protein
MKKDKISKESENVETARDKGVNSTDWLGVSKYNDYLKRIIAANKRAVEYTNYEFHKGGLKAYKDCQCKFNEFINSGDL